MLPLRIAALCCALAVPFAAKAAPYVPARDDQVVERLPGNDSSPEIKALRARLATAPDNLPLALEIARRYIETGRNEGDPRFLGYAQAVLSPWWDKHNAPVPVRVMRATIRQSQHHFPEALADLDAVVKADPRNAQAWLTMAAILQVQGRYEEARASCSKLAGLTVELVVATCLANVSGLAGEGEASRRMLYVALGRQSDIDAGVKSWALTTLAEIAQRSGDAATAERHFREALSLAPSDQYLLGAYADLLLDQRRPADVVRLLERHQRSDAMLLRLAIARKALDPAAAAEPTGMLRARFAAAARRGDTMHGREHARFLLHLDGNPSEALRAAQENWAVQKEPADARILLEAAFASGDRDAARPVQAWLAQHRIEDRTLNDLARR